MVSIQAQERGRHKKERNPKFMSTMRVGIAEKFCTDQGGEIIKIPLHILLSAATEC